jgi:hypothetical protein
LCNLLGGIAPIGRLFWAIKNAVVISATPTMTRSVMMSCAGAAAAGLDQFCDSSILQSAIIPSESMPYRVRIV